MDTEAVEQAKGPEPAVAVPPLDMEQTEEDRRRSRVANSTSRVSLVSSVDDEADMVGTEKVAEELSFVVVTVGEEKIRVPLPAQVSNLSAGQEQEELQTIPVKVPIDLNGKNAFVEINLPIPADSPLLNQNNETDDPVAHVVREDDLFRDKWEALAMKRHPDILHLKERIRPINRTTTFARLYGAGRTEVRETLSTDMVLQLIMQHLSVCGYVNTRKALENEAAVSYKWQTLNDSVLLSHLRMAVSRTERIFELAMEDANEDWKQQGSDMSDLLQELGLSRDDERDVNIYDEVQDETTIVYGEDKEPKAATLNQLIILMTTNEGIGNRDKVLKTCLLTYRSFTTPEKLMQKLLERYDVPKPDNAGQEWETKVRNPIRLFVVNVLRSWLKASAFDFTEKLIVGLRTFIVNKVARDNQSWADTIQRAIDHAQQGQEFIRSHINYEEPKVKANICSPSITWVDVDEEEIARQLTLMDFNDYSAIRPVELLNLAWSKERLRHRSPHVLGMIQRFNVMSAWCTQTILSETRLKERAKILAKLIKIAKFLQSLNNFNMLMAFMAGINDASINRLKWTKEELPASTLNSFKAIETLLSSHKAFKTYREELHKSDPPCIPYLGVYLTDLTFVEEGNKDTVNGLINFFKRKLVSNIILEVKQYQDTPYRFYPVPQIQQFFPPPRELKKEEIKASEDKNYKRSLELEPRDSRPKN